MLNHRKNSAICKFAKNRLPRLKKSFFHKHQYPYSRASAEKIPVKQWKNQDRNIAPISLTPLYQWRIKGRNEHTPRALLKRTLLKSPA